MEVLQFDDAFPSQELQIKCLKCESITKVQSNKEDYFCSECGSHIFLNTESRNKTYRVMDDDYERIRALEEKISEKDNKIRTLEEQISKKDNEIELLQQKKRGGNFFLKFIYGIAWLFLELVFIVCTSNASSALDEHIYLLGNIAVFAGGTVGIYYLFVKR